MRISIYFLISICILNACNEIPEGYSLKQNNILYQLHQIGEENKIPYVNDYITINFCYATQSDSIFYHNKSKIQIKKAEYEGSIDACFLLLSEGDSASFLLNPVNFFEKTLKTSVPSFLKEKPFFKISIKLEQIQTYADFEKQKQYFLSWINDFGEFEKLFLQQYLENHKIATPPTKSGLYKLILQQGKGSKPFFGDTVTINYQGKFLNGTFFDSTQMYNSNFEFILGSEWQVIKGIEEAVYLMQEGEQALVIMPSSLAFGNSGSSSGIVPPYTSVAYNLKLVRVAKSDSLKSKNNILKDTIL